MKIPKNYLKLLEEIRAIAKTGLSYSKDEYDKERYRRLLEISAAEYSSISGLPVNVIIDRFNREIGYITPKVGVEAAIFSKDNKILLVKRADDKMWSLPCGWAEVCETPQNAIEREVLEETSIIIKVKQLIDVFSLMPGVYGQPHTIYHILYYCEFIKGNLSCSSEVIDLDFFNYTKIKEWHKDHKMLAEKATKFHNSIINMK